MIRFRRLFISCLSFLLLTVSSRPLRTTVASGTTVTELGRIPTTASRPTLNKNDDKASPSVRKTYGKLPIYFEPNLGQTDSQVKFMARGSGVTTLLTATDAVFSLPIADFGIRNGGMTNDEASTNEAGAALLSRFGFDIRHSHFDIRQSSLQHPQYLQSAIRMKLVGANPNAQTEGADRLPGISNHFIGNDPAKWRTNIPHYGKVRYRDVYPGIDLVYRSNRSDLEYDFVVWPGGNAEAIQLAFEGTEAIELEPNGDLVLRIAGTEVRQKKPRIYQPPGKNVEGGYFIASENHIGFKIEAYESAKALVIDPVITSQTSTLSSGTIQAAAVDSSGNMYIAGAAASDFPTVPDAYSRTFQGPFRDAYVAKISADGETLVYATYIGGGVSEEAVSLAVDNTGSAFVTGSTFSANFPVTPGAIQPAHKGVTDIFVSRLNDTGSQLLYSTYLGGSGPDNDPHITLDSAGNAYVAGHTYSADYPTTEAAFQKVLHGEFNGYISKLNPAGSTLVYSTYLGGPMGNWDRIDAIGVDAEGNATVVGRTTSGNFPSTPGAFRRVMFNFVNPFVTKFNPQGSGLVYSTFLNAENETYNISGAAIGSDGSVYLTGGVVTSTFNGLQTTKLNRTGTALVYSRFGPGGLHIAVDTAGNTYTLYGDIVTKLDEAGENPVSFPTGQTFMLIQNGILVDGLGRVYVHGSVGREAFRSAGSSGQTFFRGWSVIARLSEVFVSSSTFFVPIVLSSSGLNGSFYTSELTLTNRSSRNTALEFDYTAAIGDGSGTATDQLAAGRQVIFPDAIGYLRSLGLAIPTAGNQGGTLRVRFTGASPLEAAVNVRTRTAVARGRAGLAYPGLAVDVLERNIVQSDSGLPAVSDAGVPARSVLATPVYLCGLRQDSIDRSNVALQNAGTPEQGDIRLRLTIFSNHGQSVVLPEEVLSPGSFKQINSILSSNGLQLNEGYVRVERISGTAPYCAYGVVNDQATSDGSYIPAVPAFPLAGTGEFILPAVVETVAFTSEVILTNWSGVPRALRLTLGEGKVTQTSLALTLAAGEQRIIPNFLQWLRDQSYPAVPPRGPDLAKALFVAVAEGSNGVFVGGRTSAPGTGGRFGVFYSAVPYGQAAGSFFGSRWLYGLQQNAENRSHIAIVNTAGVDLNYTNYFGSGPEDIFRVELFDGDTGQKVATVEGPVRPGEWRQFSSILAQYAPAVRQAYARVSQIQGRNPFIAYAVINDGGVPGERTGDGAFIASSP